MTKSKSNSKTQTQKKKSPSMKKKEFEQLYHVFFACRRFITKDDVLTDQEVERYFSAIGQKQKESFTLSGHLILGVFLKQIYNDKLLSDVFKAITPFLSISSKEKTHIKDTINLIFQDNTSRVKVLDSTVSSQKGGVNIQNIWFAFSTIFLICQITFYMYHMEYIQKETLKLDNEMKQLPIELNRVLQLTANTSIQELYTEISETSIESSWVHSILTKTIYPMLIEHKYRTSDEFQKNTEMFSMYVSILNDGFVQYITEPSHQFTTMFNQAAMKRRNRVLEDKFRKDLETKIAMFQITSRQNTEFFSDSSHFTNKDRDELLKKVDSFENALNKILVKLSTDSDRVSLKDDKEMDHLLESIENIGEHMDSQKQKLEEKLEHLSDSREISLLSDHDHSKKDFGPTSKAPKLISADKIQSILGIKVLKEYEKYFTSQVHAYVNTALEPLLQTMKKIRDTIHSVINTLDITVRTVRNVASKLKTLYDDDELGDVLNSMPTQLKLFISIFYRMKYILGFLFTFYASLFRFLLKIGSKGLEYTRKKNRTAKKSKSPIKTPGRFSRSKSKSPSKSASKSASKSETRSKSQTVNVVTPNQSPQPSQKRSKK